MAVVRTLPNGTYFMTYELAARHTAAPGTTTPTDGTNWGNPAWLGHRIAAGNGSYMRNTPTSTVVNNGTSTGQILLVGHYYVDASGKPTAANGGTLITNSAGGSRPR